MKRFTTLLAGSAFAAALSFGAQAPAATATDHPATTATTTKHVKKHKKAKKNAAPTAAATTTAPSATPAKK